MLTDMPYKITNAITFNLILYFMVNLNRHPGNFFFFILISFTLTLVMSMLFRTIASVSRTLSQAMAPAAVLILAIVIYTGFALPVPNMRGWARWINYMDPVAYGFESLMINEFAGRVFTCNPDQFVPNGPGYTNVSPSEQVCGAVGAVAGSSVVDGTAYIESSYQYFPSHKWRNFGILWVFLIGLCAMYLIATEYVTAKKSKGEVLLFRRGHTALKKKPSNDEEAGSTQLATLEKGATDASAILTRQTAIFHWEDVCYDIKIKGEGRRILDHVDGWVKPGTLTALMGVSGAGKTTLLDVLATRTTMGVITGGMLVDGRERDASFQRKTGYVQQQDLHLSTSTVREALNFSALLRQPAKVPRKEKLDYVNEVIKLLDMQEYADAVVGVPGEGLNVEQRKRLTIGVELAAKPELLLFLDEPTSGLDSQTSWAICDLMEKLTKNGQAVLCTIHQPSAMLFQRFDRLLFLAKGGKTVYFGEVGNNANILTKYFERNGAFACPPDANPAEWMLEVIGAAPGSHTDIDWYQTWRNSPEYKEVHQELDRLKEELSQITQPSTSVDDKASFREFAAPFTVQLWETGKRVFEQYWRTPSYIYSKASLCIFSVSCLLSCTIYAALILQALFIGFSFYNAGTSQQELQNQMFAIFMLFTIFGQLVQQIMPHFVTQRALYEARERPSKAYSWKAFMISNIVVELPWNTLMAILIFFCWYYPIGLYKNAEPTGAITERGGLMFLLIWEFLLFTSTFTTMVVAAIETAETAGNIAQPMFSLCLVFCGVLASPNVFPRFWIFMYRVSPFTYLVDAMLSVGVANNAVVCAANEIRHFDPPSGQTCFEYMQTFINSPYGGGYLTDNNATSNCGYCSLGSTNQFLAAVSSSYALRWRNFGILWAFIIFNAFAAVFLYWLVRVPKKSGRKVKKA
jgi:ABC-type multidrug transport system permease subunit/ABC-type multidrug transport system ATPase subunit